MPKKPAKITAQHPSKRAESKGTPNFTGLCDSRPIEDVRRWLTPQEREEFDELASDPELREILPTMMWHASRAGAREGSTCVSTEDWGWKRINVFLPEHPRLEALAGKTGLSVAELVRRAVDEYLNRQG